MKKTLSLLLLFIALLLTTVSTLLVASEQDREFGVRLMPGIATGIGDSLTPGFGFETDFFLLSDTFRMNLGGFLLAPGNDLPVNTIHSLGIESQHPFHKGHLFSGIKYQKSWIGSKKDQYDYNRGLGFYSGYQQAISKKKAVFIAFGSMIQPLKNINGSNANLKNRIYFLQAGMEYFVD